jgi:CheY-like chemotaxis protein
MGNAVKFTEKGGICVQIKMFEGRDRDFLRIEVHDTGVGVPPQKRQEIFQEFVQADSTHARKFGGSGLGLAISKRLVETMGGEIGIEASAENGSIFWFTLPAVVVRSATEDESPIAGKRIAIVTRNKILREGLAAQIGQAGAEALNFSHLPPDSQIDAILIDAGTDSEPDPFVQPNPDVPALVLVTPQARVRLEALKAMGFAGYLVKPVRETSLIQRLDIVMQDAAAPSQTSSDAPQWQNSYGGISPEEIAFDPPAPLPPAPPPPPFVTAPAAPQIGLKILLAEDNPVNALLIRELLRRRGHRITEVTTGTAAAAAMENDRFDLLLTDIHMPGMDGIEATRTIRAMEARDGRTRTPIVALTADALETGKRACQEAGMDGFLTKPVDPAELEEMFLMLFPSEDGVLQTAAA